MPEITPKSQRDKYIQYAAVAIPVVILIVLFGLAYFLRGTRTVAETAASKPLVAKTTRENYQVLRSANRDVDYDALTPSGTAANLGGQGSADAANGSATEEAEEQPDSFVFEERPRDETPATAEMPETTPPEPAADPAAPASTPEEDIAAILGAFTNIEEAANAASVYRTLGDLYLQSTPPQVDQAKQSYAAALDLATSEEEKVQAAIAQADLLLIAGTWDEVVSVLDKAPRRPLESVADVRLQLLRGAMADRDGDVGMAEEYYASAINAADSLLKQGPGAEAVLREGCLKLARIYRQTGRNEKADSLAERLRAATKASPPAEAES